VVAAARRAARDSRSMLSRGIQVLLRVVVGVIGGVFVGSGIRRVQVGLSAMWDEG